MAVQAFFLFLGGSHTHAVYAEQCLRPNMFPQLQLCEQLVGLGSEDLQSARL